MPNRRAAASSTRRPSGMTSLPMPSPAMTAMRWLLIPVLLKTWPPAHPDHALAPEKWARPGIPSARPGPNLGQRLTQVVHHRPDREHGRGPDQPAAPQPGIHHAEQPPVVEQKGDGQHLHHGLDLAEHVHGHALAGA